jgi:hypothetical protein
MLNTVLCSVRSGYQPPCSSLLLSITHLHYYLYTALLLLLNFTLIFFFLSYDRYRLRISWPTHLMATIGSYHHIWWLSRPWQWSSIQVVTRRYYNGSFADSEEKIGDMSLPEQAMNSWYSVVLLRMIAFHYRFRNPIHIIIFLHIIVYTSSPYWPCIVIHNQCMAIP